LVFFCFFKILRPKNVSECLSALVKCELCDYCRLRALSSRVKLMALTTGALTFEIQKKERSGDA